MKLVNTLRLMKMKTQYTKLDKLVFGENLQLLVTILKKDRRSQIENLTFHLKKLENEHIKSKATNKTVTQNRVEIS